MNKRPPKKPRKKRKAVDEFTVSGPLAGAVTTLASARALAALGLVKLQEGRRMNKQEIDRLATLDPHDPELTAAIEAMRAARDAAGLRALGDAQTAHADELDRYATQREAAESSD